MDTRPGQGANKRTADGGRACEGLRVTLSGTGTGQDRTGSGSLQNVVVGACAKPGSL